MGTVKSSCDNERRYLWVERSAGLRPTRARDVVRGVALDVLSMGSRWTSRQCQRPRVQILLLHHVFGDEENSFRCLLETLQTRFRFITYGEAVDRIVHGTVDDAYLTFSFDDGLKCCRRAAEIMNEFGAKGCFFLCPPIIGETNYETVGRFCRERLWIPPVEFMTWDDVEWLQDNGNEIGGHSMQHLDLGQIPITQAQEEIAESFDVLTHRLGSVDHFAWPYGRSRHIRPELISYVFDAGYRSCASGERGCHVPRGGSINHRGVVLRRDTIVSGWPVTHIQYFLDRSARRAASYSSE